MQEQPRPAAGCGTHAGEGVLCWERHDEWVQSATGRCGAEEGLRALVQGLGGTQWDWQVWDERQRAPQCYGVTGTLEEAKAKAERAWAKMAKQLRRPQPTAG